jgi:hypothetical protein
MPDEHNAFDLAKLLADNSTEQERWVDTALGPKIDTSGKPKPVNVRVQLNSGIEVKCDVRYSGINPKDGDRLFTVIAEIDWENYFPVALIVEEMPNDCEFRFRVPGVPDDVAQKFAERLEFRPERIVRVK